MKTHHPALTFSFILSLLILIPLEFFCAELAFETLGEITSVFYFLLISLNVVPILFFIFKKKMAGVIISFIIGLAIIPYQLKLGHRLLLLKEESANMVNYAYEYKLQHGDYPKDASGYMFKYPALKKYIDYSYTQKDHSFSVYYWVGTKSTSHFYRPELKKWDYYPD